MSFKIHPTQRVSYCDVPCSWTQSGSQRRQQRMLHAHGVTSYVNMARNFNSTSNACTLCVRATTNILMYNIYICHEIYSG